MSNSEKVKTLEENYGATQYNIPKQSRDIMEAIIKEVRPYSMVPDAGLMSSMDLVMQAIQNDIPGDIVEVGTWKGGSSLAMLLIQKRVLGSVRKRIFMLDSFEGMGMPASQDGEQAIAWKKFVQENPDHPGHFNNCAASLEETQQLINSWGFYSDTALIKGWVEDTLIDFHCGPIAVLRIDCDWYSPCRASLAHLEHRVSDKGFIIMDDYYVWQGCMQATHEYLANNNLRWPIRPAIDMCGAFLVKKKSATG